MSLVLLSLTPLMFNLTYLSMWLSKSTWNFLKWPSNILLLTKVLSVIPLYSWKALSFTQLSQSMTILNAVDGGSFWPHRIIPSLHVQLRGESVSIEVEVVNAPLDYNILMGRNWIYAMKTVVLSVFRVVSFPHKGESWQSISYLLLAPIPLHRWDLWSL